MSNKSKQTSETTRVFTLEFLKQITDNFSKEHIIGHGGYGVVYKGVLEDGEEIALKKLYYVPGLDDTQFRNEFNNLMRAQHPNITRLVGYCYFQGHERIKVDNEYVFAHSEERVLCLEYLHGGSLDIHISDESCGLDWETRFKIIKGVSEGLDYLHNGTKEPIYHLDLKPGNILLDKNMVPKIGDFGLSKLFPSAQTYVTIKITGTPGYMPPEYIERNQITPKFDVFSLGVIIIRIMSGEEGYSRYPQMSSQEFADHVHENWADRLQESMSPHTSEQVMTCITIALRCVEYNREKRPTIADIVDELTLVGTIPSREVANLGTRHAINQTVNSECRGTIAFSAAYRPLVPFDIFSCSVSPSSSNDEVSLTDGLSYNYNGRPIPTSALKTLLKNPKLAEECSATDADVDAGHVSGLIFVSERDDGLETLYIAVRYNADSKVKVFALADIFGTDDFRGARLEDSGCFGGGFTLSSKYAKTIGQSLIYISTKEQPSDRRRPWTAVYKTDLTTGRTVRLSPIGQYDLSPAVSPSGRKVAVASYWDRRSTEGLKTDIILMNADRLMGALNRTLVIRDGGWPSWGSDNIIFFHRGTDKTLPSGMVKTAWAVFRFDMDTRETVQVTPDDLDAVTPAAISETKVAVATIRQKSELGDVGVEAKSFRHIEIFDMSAPGLPPVQITQKTSPRSDHYNPFVMDGGARIGYHRCRSDLSQQVQVPLNLHKLESPESSDDISLFRESGVFPTISKDGYKLAFVDNGCKAVWVADSRGLRIVHEEQGPNSVFCPVWNQNPEKDTLYICVGPSLSATEPLEIYSIRNATSSTPSPKVRRITYGGFNNAFPSSSPEGNKFVFRSTRGGGAEKHKNLYIMLQTDSRGTTGEGWVTRLTKGQWTDTHCQWSPNGDWIVFSSTRRWGADELDPGYFSHYLVKATDPTVVIRVINGMGGHINHPVFSPDGRSIAVTADLASMSVERISLPESMHALRPYGDIFAVNIVDPCTNGPYEDEDLTQNQDVDSFCRITHSRYECGTPAWTGTLAAPWNILMDMKPPYRPAFIYVHPEPSLHPS